MIKTVTKNPEAFTRKPSGDMEELVIGLTKIVFLFIFQIFLLCVVFREPIRDKSIRR